MPPKFSDMQVAPRKLKFAMNSLNLIDLATILPFYLEIVLEEFVGINANELRNVKGDMTIDR